jgi:hypothetical protein
VAFRKTRVRAGVPKVAILALNAALDESGYATEAVGPDTSIDETATLRQLGFWARRGALEK